MKNQKIILIRHASVTKKIPRDTLTELGNKYSNQLPALLKKNGYIPNKIYFVNKDKSNKSLTRCELTVRKFKCDKVGIKYNNFKVEGVEDEIVIFCYIKQAITKLPEIPSIIIRSIQNKDATKEQSDDLYEWIIVLDKTDHKISVEKVFKTQDKSIERQEE